MRDKETIINDVHKGLVLTALKGTDDFIIPIGIAVIETLIDIRDILQVRAKETVKETE